MGRFTPAHPDCVRERSAPWTWPWARPGYIVLHTMEGSMQGTEAWFKRGSPPRPVATAAHYLIGKDGAVVQMVHDAKKCAHAGNYNSRSIGIEHEGFAAVGEFPPAMLAESARIVSVLCAKYGIPTTREHIIGHVEVPGAQHSDPGEFWPWDDYMGLVIGDAP